MFFATFELFKNACKTCIISTDIIMH